MRKSRCSCSTSARTTQPQHRTTRLQHSVVPHRQRRAQRPVPSSRPLTISRRLVHPEFAGGGLRAGVSPVAPAGQPDLQSEKSRVFLEPNGWRQRGPGNYTGPKNFKVYKQEKPTTRRTSSSSFSWGKMAANAPMRSTMLPMSGSVTTLAPCFCSTSSSTGTWRMPLGADF